ncbi:MAG: hypothetical protein J7L31_05550 [Thermoplasmata archaeon]|nr:hypothetical protein [Thermoplasmata archaeon]
MKRVIIVGILIMISIIPLRVHASNHQLLPIDLPDDMKGQPIDIRVDFQKTCYAVDENRHSIRLLYNGREIESQIYDLEFEGKEKLVSCNLVFIYQGKGEYILEYGEDVRDVDYIDHLKVNDIYYFIEPIPGYYAKINCYEIEEDGKSIFGICQDGSILGIEMGNKVITMKEGVEKFEMKNWDQFFSFAFFHSDGEEKGSDEKLQGKKILVDGNLMVRIALNTSSRDEKLRTEAIYTYYYSPHEKRLFVKLKHESREEWNGNITYAYFSSIHSTSKSIEELNMGRIMPYIHINGKDGIEEYKLNTNPESKEFQWIISAKDAVYMGQPPWVSVDDKKKAYALIFSKSLLVTAATKEEINVPGLEVDGGGVNMGAYGRVNEGVAYDGVVEAFIGNYSDVKMEGDAFEILMNYRNLGGGAGEYEKEAIHNLTVVAGMRHSIPFSTHISALLGIKIPHMEIEIWEGNRKVASGAVNFRKIDFQLPDGNYTIKAFRLGINGKKFIGEKYVELKKDERVKVWCTFQSHIKVKSVEGSVIKIFDGKGGMVGENVSHGIITIPLPAIKRYTLQIIYHGFLMEEKEIFLLLPASVEYSFPTYDFAVDVKDSLGLPFGEKVTVFMYSDEMRERENIYGVKDRSIYSFSSLPSATYHLVVTYKGTSVDKKIVIPDENMAEIVLPVDYGIKVKTYDSRGFPLSTKIYFEREGKKFSGERLPPGEYCMDIYRGGKKIASREILVNGDANYDVITNRISFYPFIIPLAMVVFALIAKRKEAYLGLLLSLSLLFPWWRAKGMSSTSLYLFPPSMIEMKSTYGNIVSLPSPLLMALYISLILLLASLPILFHRKYSKFSIATVAASLSIFLYTIYRFSSITVGSIAGGGSAGNVSSWGMGIGFYLALLSLVLITVKVIYDETGRSG